MSLVLTFVALSAVMALAWVWQRRTRNIGWVDVFWTFGTAAAGSALTIAWVQPNGSAGRRLMVMALVVTWALRLGLFVGARVARSPEDGRYRQIRQEWGPHLQGRLFSFLQLQALVSLILAAAIALAANRPGPLSLQDLAGLLIAGVAIGGEALADRQMRSFASRPENRGKVCDRGLWSWSRHPNYVFEWLGWVAYPVIAIDLAGGYPQAWIALAAPAIMFLVLRFGTGVPPLEAHMLRSRGAAYRAYQARVPAFLPLPSRKVAKS